MFRFLLVSLLFAVSAAFQAPALPSKLAQSNICMQHGGKGFGGGEATRDPAPTYVDPNDPKGKQQAIHKAESFADYLARRTGGAAAPAPAPAAPVYEAPAPAPAYEAPAPVAAAPHDGKGFGGGEATRDPAPTYVDPNDPKGKQQAIHKAESFADYLARRQGGAAAPAPAPAAPVYEAAPAPAPAYEAPAPVSYAGEDAAKAAWLAKLGSRGQWGQPATTGNVVPTQPIYEAAPAAAPAPAVEATGSTLFEQYMAQRGN